jgi:hypothetical protein
LNPPSNSCRGGKFDVLKSFSFQRKGKVSTTKLKQMGLVHHALSDAVKMLDTLSFTPHARIEVQIWVFEKMQIGEEEKKSRMKWLDAHDKQISSVPSKVILQLKKLRE